MTKPNEMILVEGSLTVNPARGYWFSAGGEKGSFGYYPHLKDACGYPVYPDTQLHGDLRMAAQWLLNLKEKTEMDEVGSSDAKEARLALFNRIFGFGGEKNTEVPIPSRLFLTDLALTEAAKKLWTPLRFEVKPRIEINDDIRTVKKHMLAYLEMAYLEGLELTAGIHLGYYRTRSEAEQAWAFLREAAEILNGFGAFRSRGYSRGAVKIRNEEKYTGIPAEKDQPPVKGGYYFLKALVPFRNKPVEPGRTQTVECLHFVEADQLRGWFVRAYHDLYGDVKGGWPTPEEMALISFPTLYPCPPDMHALAYPPAMTTLIDEAGNVADVGEKPKSRKEREEEAIDNGKFFSGKTKPLGKDRFVSLAGAQPPITTIPTERRFRNAMGEDFVTTADGLFIQEMVKPGAVFGGWIGLPVTKISFASRVLHILKHVRPDIKGAVFQPTFKEESVAPWEHASAKPHLVISPIAITGLKRSEEETHVTLTTLRRYNTMLKRPRRNRIVIAPGSILSSAPRKETVACTYWEPPVLRKEPSTPDGKPSKKESESACGPSAEDIFIGDPGKDWQRDLTKAQVGNLREFLSPNMTLGAARRILAHLAEKHGKKRDGDKHVGTMGNLYDRLARIAQTSMEKKGGMVELRSYIDALIEAWTIWQAGNKLEKLTKERLTRRSPS